MPHVPPISLPYMMNITNDDVQCVISDDIFEVLKIRSPNDVAGCPPRSLEHTLDVFCNSIGATMWF